MPAGPLTIFHVTDVHGRIEPLAWPLDPDDAPLLRPGSPVSCHAGLAALETVLVQQAERCRRDGHQLMFVSCGDLLGIEMFHDWVDHGRSTLEAMEALTEAAGIDTCIHLLGNHAVDCGVDELLELRKHSTRFQFISGNVSIDGEPVSNVGHEPIVVGDWRLALLNLTTTEIHSDARAEDRHRIQTTEPLPSARAELARIDASQLDALIGVVHLSNSEDEQLIALGQLDVLMGGHSHTLHGRSIGANGWYAKAGFHGMVLGVVTLVPHADGPRVAKDQSWLVPAFDPPGPDSRVLRSFRTNDAKLRVRNPGIFEPIALLPDAIGWQREVRRRETPLGRLVADVIRQVASTPDAPVDVAFINGGNIRADLNGEAQQVAPVHLHGVVPYGNRVAILELGLSELRRLLAISLANMVAEKGAGHLQWSGLEASFDAALELGELRLAATGAVISPGQVIRVATIDYLAQGKHHFDFLPGCVVDSGPRLVDAWIELARPPNTIVRAPTTPCVTIPEDAMTVPNDTEVIEALERINGHALPWLRDALRKGTP